MTEALKDIIDRAKGPGTPRILVLFSKKANREAFRIELANAADEADFPYFYQAGNSITRVGDAVVHLRVAHDNIDRELRGVEWASVHGLGCLENFKNGFDMAIAIQVMVR